jgi:DNA-binding NtrC family response regulator
MDVAELVFLKDEEPLLKLRLDRAEVCIGSNPTCDVVVPDPGVPDVAALLYDRGARRFHLRDLTNGALLLNGNALDGEEADLGDGDRITVGKQTMRLSIRAGEVGKKYGTTNVLDVEHGGTSRASVVHRGHQYTIEPGRPFNVGGHEDNELRLQDPFVSSFHCRIENRSGRWFLEDLDSTNGTQVNGLRVIKAELPTPATIKIGNELLGFSSETIEHDEAPDFFHGMLGVSETMKRVFELIRRLSDAREPVLILGESGSGKELVARALHDESSRAAGPYLALNCGALSTTLIESELFGYVKGAFTGANEDKAGAFEAANGGTLFLDEIGELPLDLQPKLLRVLETSTVRRVGDTRERGVDTRIIAATHRNLEELVADGSFREDLFHRLFVLTIPIPALQERGEDILALAEHFIETQAPRKLVLSQDAREAVLDYTWPGNIRELRNVIVRAILLTDGGEIGVDDLQFSRDAFTSKSRDARRSVRRHDEVERNEVMDALDQARGNRAEAARILGVSKSTFHDRLKRYGVPKKFGPKR